MTNRPMRTLIIGARGQLGSDLAQALPGQVCGVDLPELDVRNAGQVRAAVREAAPDHVINCAAQTNVDRCEGEPLEALVVDALGALHVAKAAAEIGAELAYISTDYVFGALPPRAEAYGEDEPPAPLNVYGVSKLAGEHMSRAGHPDPLVVRTCGLYGRAGARGKGGNFVETMLRLAAAGRPIRVVNDQRVSPTSTVYCARAIAELLAARVTGVVHIVASGSCTWFEFAREIFTCLYPDAEPMPISSGEYAAAAKRPPVSALCSTRLAELGMPAAPTWQELLHAYMDARPYVVASPVPPAGAQA